MVPSGLDRFVVGIEEAGFYICKYNKSMRLVSGLNIKEFELECKERFGGKCFVSGDDSVFAPNEFTSDPKMIRYCERLRKLFIFEFEDPEDD